MKFRIKYELPDGMLFIDKLIFAKDEHDGMKVASNQFEYYFSESIKQGMPFEHQLYLREAKLIIKQE